MTNANYAKITKDVDCLFYSTPCTSVSVAGQNKGMKEGDDTASALIWHTRRAIESLKPKVCILENVKGMTMGNNLKEFHKWQQVMESYGYTNFSAVLDAQDYGVPQHRERLFMVSILDCDKPYHFPKPFKLEKRIKDILEPYGTVDESYYYTAKQLCSIFDYTAKKKSEGCGFQTSFQTEEAIACCDTTRYGSSYTGTYLKEPAIQQRLSLYNNNAQAGRVYDINGISPCVDTFSGKNKMPKILEPLIMQRPHGWNKGHVISQVSPTITTARWETNNLLMESCILGYTRSADGKVISYHDKNIANTVHTSTGSGGNTDQFVKEPLAVAQRGRNPQNPSDRAKGSPTQQRLEFGDNVANCITTVQKDSMVAEPITDGLYNLPDKTVLSDENGRGYLWQDNALWRIRKLIPMEVGRLMDVSDEDIQKMIDAGIAKTKLYGLFGNSIVVNVLYCIFKRMWIDTADDSVHKSLFEL